MTKILLMVGLLSGTIDWFNQVFSMIFFFCSDDFRSIVDISLRKVVDGLVEEVEQSSGGSSPSSGVPLAKLLPRVAQLGPELLEEPSQNRYLQIIRSTPEVELFFTLLYANMPPHS